MPYSRKSDSKSRRNPFVQRQKNKRCSAFQHPAIIAVRLFIAISPKMAWNSSLNPLSKGLCLENCPYQFGGALHSFDFIYGYFMENAQTGSESPALPREALSLSLNALLVMAHYHGVAANGEDLLHRFAGNGRDLDQEEWLLAARYLGLKVRVVSRSMKRLHLLALPAVVWRDDGKHFILARIDEARFFIQDLESGRPVVLSQEEFAERFSGRLILVASRASVLGSLAKFDFTWFIPAIIKYRRIFLEVLAVSVVIQLFALITPLFFQVVMDKVLVHRGFSTLDVIAVAFVVVTIFEVVLSGLRTYVFAHTTSRVDVELGARLYRHLLQLPIAYFEQRRVGDTVARVRELEQIRNFLTGQALTSVLDLAFSFIFIAVMWFYSGWLTLIVIAL